MATIKTTVLVTASAFFIASQVIASASVKKEKPKSFPQATASKKTAPDSAPNFDLVIRYVDTYSVLRTSKEGELIGKELEAKRMELAKEIKELEQQFAAAAKELQAKASTLTDAGREREQKRMVKMEREYKAKLQEADEDMKITMQSAQERLLREHNNAVYKFAQANDIDLVFGPGGVVFASEKANCTLGVIEGMNKNYEVKLAKGNASSSTVASNKKTAKTT